jgi:amphi-Trp domain-containing protein
MPDDTIYESETKRSRRGIAIFFRRIARRLGRGETVPVDEEQSVVFDAPDEAELEVDIEREDGEISLGFEMEWAEEEGGVDTDAAESKATFELYEDAAEEWRWRLRHDNGNIIADSGEGYSSKRAARQGLESVQTNAAGGHVIDLTRDEEVENAESGSSATFEIYQDAAEGWRWRLRHDNGNIIADCGGSYSSKQKTKQGMRSVRTNAAGAPVEET